MKLLPLGPFDVSEPVGRGGMGSVWRGVHRDSGLPVAVKVLHRSAVRDTKTSASFKNEVRAVAGLDHPGIVWVFDVGTVTPAAAQGSNGLLEEGAPYLAMEYASGGTLAEFVPRSWDEVQALLLDLLGALGHAHSRGVVHRDLKPGNVILGTSNDVRPGWKLTDFGIAAALEETLDKSIARGLVGTLAYMSPEQIKGDWRDFGPWTDLYALGCIVYRVVGNQRPFRETRGPALIAAHLVQRPQRLVPRVPVPQLFPQWVALLLEKSPRDRFQSAAEAARILRGLGPPVVHTGLVDLTTGPTADAEGPTDIPRRTPTSPAEALPADWRALSPPWPPPRLVGAGLGLFGLRAVPMVGREAERDALWGVLHAVLSSGRARVAVVRGSVGAGKTRLARWLGETAHALAGFPFLVGEARADEPPQEALARPLRRFFRTVRLPVDERNLRLKKALALEDDDPLLPMLSAMLGAEGESGPALEGEARHAVARRVLERLASPLRPVVLLLDDAHHAADAVRFAKHLLDAQQVRPLPVLLVLTVAEEAAAAEASLWHELLTLLELRGVERVSLGPLPAADHERLIQGMLPFDPTVSALLRERTHGNPLHATEIVKDWVTHHRLVRGAGGYELSDDAPPLAPLGQVWRNHVDHVVAGLPEEAVLVLERAAALGSPVDDDEWQRVCDDPKGAFAAAGRVRFVPENAVLRNELRMRLFAAHLAEETETGWAFVHEMLREALLEQARAEGRFESHHRACARMLLHRPDARLLAERIGRHLLLGARPAQAVPHLLAGFRRVRRRAGDVAALPVLLEAERALKAAGTPEGDPLWVEVSVRRAELLERLERPEDAARWAQRGQEAAARHGSRLWEARALLVRARAAMLQRLPDQADGHLSRAESLLRDDVDARWAGEVQAARAWCARLQGDPARARGHAYVAARFLSTVGERVGAAHAWSVLAENAFHERQAKGDGAPWAEAERYWERARSGFAKVGNAAREADAITGLGNIARLRGDLEKAMALLRLALDRYQHAGSARANQAMLGLARLHLARREWEEARRVAGAVVTGTETARQGPLEADIHAVLLAAAAGLRDWSAFDVHLEQLRRTLRGSGVFVVIPGKPAGGPRLGTGPEVDWCLDLAGARLEAGSEAVRARAVRELLGG